MAYATNRTRVTAHTERMAASSARLVPERVPVGYVGAPNALPWVVVLGGAVEPLAWRDLAAHWSLPELAGVVVEPEVHCWVTASGLRVYPDRGEMNAWIPSPRFFGEGARLNFAAYRRGVVRLWPFVEDARHVRLVPSGPMPELPGLPKGLRDALRAAEAELGI